MDSCIADGEKIELDFVTAVKDFEQKSFSGARKGLIQIAAIIKLLPASLKDCNRIDTDIEVLIEMAETFVNPLTLIFHIGKELYVNGVNIFEDIYEGINYYHKGEYFNFGKSIGDALDLVFLKNSATKRPKDANAYDFIDGFCTASSSIEVMDLDQHALYNNIDGLGSMIYGPVEDNLKNFEV